MYISDRQSKVFPAQKIFRYTLLARGTDRSSFDSNESGINSQVNQDCIYYFKTFFFYIKTWYKLFIKLCSMYKIFKQLLKTIYKAQLWNNYQKICMFYPREVLLNFKLFKILHCVNKTVNLRNVKVNYENSRGNNKKTNTTTSKIHVINHDQHNSPAPKEPQR